jgi:hypothetical protein
MAITQCDMKCHGFDGACRDLGEEIAITQCDEVSWG